MREPNFDNLLQVLRCREPERPTLFEFFLNQRLYRRLAGASWSEETYLPSWYGNMVTAFGRAGYDYATVAGSTFRFPSGERAAEKTVSLNDGAVIVDRTSFDSYAWPEPDPYEYDDLATVELPPGMKLIVCGPGGVLENVITLVGYDTLCFMLADDPALAEAVFAAVGSRLVRHYELAVRHETVGACISNDDWGFKTQTMLSVRDMRRFVFPWHKRIVAAIHAGGKPAILHCCGNLEEVMEDIISDMRYDGKHSYEDTIQPVEEAYEQYGGRIAILGGLDVDFVVRSTPEDVYKRSRAMVEKAAARGGYALGTGNTVPEYVPRENYFAMISAATEAR